MQPNDNSTQIGKVEIGFAPKIFGFVSVGGISCMFLYNKEISSDSYIYSYSNAPVREFNFDGTKRKTNFKYGFPLSSYDCGIKIRTDTTGITITGFLNNQTQIGTIYWFASE